MTAALIPSSTERPQLRLVPTGDDVVVPFDRRGWAVSLAAVLLVVLVAVGAVAMGRGAFAGAVPGTPAAVAAGPTIVAEPGDTLWTIARRVAPGTDVRPLVDDLVALNGSTIQPGQAVRLPVG